MKKRLSTFLAALMILNGLVLGLAVNESTSTTANAVDADYLPNETEGFFSSNASSWQVNDNNTYMLSRHFVKVGILFYKLNKVTREAMVAGYDHRIDTGTALVIPETIEVTAATIESETAQIKTDFSGTYTVSYIGRGAFKTNAGDSAPTTPMNADFSSITLPNTIKVIGGEAFFGQCMIREFIIPDSVTDIGTDAFLRMDPFEPHISQCSTANIGLHKLTIGSKVSRFYTGAFGRNSKLETMTIRADSANFETATAIAYPSSYDTWQYVGPGINGFITYQSSATNTCTGNIFRLAGATVTVQGAFYSGWTRWATNCFQTAASVTASSFTPNQPDSPTAVSRTLNSVTVGVSTQTANGGSAITNYRVTAFPGGAFSDLPGATGGNVVISGLSNSTAYTFKVIATNAIGDSIPSIASATISTLSPTRPNAPNIGVATVVDSRTASITFTAPADNGGSPITSFTVTSYPSRRSGTGSASPIQVTGLTLNSPETFTVTATNAVGTSDSSTASNVITPKEMYTVNFDSQGGSSISSGNFVSGESVTAPASSPTKSGNAFNGWFAASSGGTQLTFPYSPGVTSNITLYAQWTLVSTTPAPVVLGPPASTFVVVTSPKISRTNDSYICTSGSYAFKRQGGAEEASKISSQQIRLLSNGRVVDSDKSLEVRSTFVSNPSYKGTTMSCEIGIKQEGIEQNISSLNSKAIADLETAKTAEIYGSNNTFYTERDAAYLKRSAGDNTSWKDMLEKAVAKRESSKLQAEINYISNLEKAGISILVALDKTAPNPTPTPIPTPETLKTVNVQPTAMIKVGSIYFASGTYFLNDEAKKTIKALATSIFMKSPTTVLSYGFTDSKGGTDNTLLSQNRSKAVAKLLRDLLPGQKIVTGWYASSKPVATGTSKAALAQNRRVEIYIK